MTFYNRKNMERRFAKEPKKQKVNFNFGSFLEQMNSKTKEELIQLKQKLSRLNNAFAGEIYADVYIAKCIVEKALLKKEEWAHSQTAYQIHSEINRDINKFEDALKKETFDSELALFEVILNLDHYLTQI